MSKSLNDTVAIVTGGGRGIGRVISRMLAEAGAAVGLFGRNADRLEAAVQEIERAGGRATALPGDVTQKADVDRAVAQVRAAFGPVNLLVNNAGLTDHPAALADADPNHWWRVIEVNLRGPFLFLQAAIPDLVASGQGRVVNMSTGAAIFPMPYSSAYGVSKTAFLRLSETVAAELADTGVKLFDISAGRVITDMTAGLDEAMAAVNPDPMVIDPAFIREPEEAARLVCDIATGRLDRLSGRFFNVLDDLDSVMADMDRIAAENLRVLTLRR